MSLHIFGIRHHGPGSARRLKEMLNELQPDIVLVEGPPEAEPLLSLITDQGMQPPVAILAYMPEEPQEAVFYPFADFSPEWQAFQYAAVAGIPVRLMDLPLTHVLAMDRERKRQEVAVNQTEPATKMPGLPEVSGEEGAFTEIEPVFSGDPMGHLAHAAGYTDSELWWEHNFEQRLSSNGTFEAIMEAMHALRTTLPPRLNPLEVLREAAMRKIIRTAQKEGYRKIAVVCGAWHAPALAVLPPPKEDDELLKKLPKVKVEATWIPWTYDRLTFASGYGAGISSPGWYHHLWDHPHDTGAIWMSKVARLLRSKNMDTSVAHIIESVRLAEMLATLRQLPRPGLDELSEATRSVIGFGDDLLLNLIGQELVVSNRIGSVPEKAPKVPLQYDMEMLQKKLRLPIRDYQEIKELDLRNATDLERSRLLHRLRLLEVNWGQQESGSRREKGTFRETWTLKWKPELWIKVVERGVWGNTVEEATSKFVQHQAMKEQYLSGMTALLEQTLPAELPLAMEFLMHRIENMAAVTGDILQLVQALPPLVYIMRYGNVRKTDTAILSGLVDGMMTRICIGLPRACHSLDDDTSLEMTDHLQKMNEAVNLLQQEEQQQRWQQTLHAISAMQVHGRVAGYVSRLLVDARLLSTEETAAKFSQALSTANPPAYSGAWLEGFLKGSGMILLLDNVLWNMLNEWVATLENEVFVQLLPLMRRTFSLFSPDERRKLGEKARGREDRVRYGSAQSAEFDEERAKKAMEVVGRLMGIN